MYMLSERSETVFLAYGKSTIPKPTIPDLFLRAIEIPER